jgi:hypothetical protein
MTCHYIQQHTTRGGKEREREREKDGRTSRRRGQKLTLGSGQNFPPFLRKYGREGNYGENIKVSFCSKRSVEEHSLPPFFKFLFFFFLS